MRKVAQAACKLAKGPIVNFPSAQRTASAEPYPRQIENWRLPDINLLREPEYNFNAQQEERVRAQAKILEQTLEEFRLDARVVEIDTGPVITMFELKVGAGVKVSQIASLSNDIARALKLSLDRIMESVEEIMGLEPKPGRRFGGSDSRYIVPDVVVHKMGGEYVVVLNEDGVPRLRVNSLYRSLLRTAGSEAREYVEQKLRSAVWLIKSVDQRQRTLRKVTQSIVKFQREFLDKGMPCLRPLSLRDVGEDIGMHESTISRVTTNKYVETPQGLFELKFFFHSGIASGDGEMVSSVSVKKMIQDLLANEDPSKPLSDQEVALILKGRGLTIARRTVAKYREELGILPSHQRRLAPRRR